MCIKSKRKNVPSAAADKKLSARKRPSSAGATYRGSSNPNAANEAFKGRSNMNPNLVNNIPAYASHNRLNAKFGNVTEDMAHGDRRVMGKSAYKSASDLQRDLTPDFFFNHLLPNR